MPLITDSPIKTVNTSVPVSPTILLLTLQPYSWWDKVYSLVVEMITAKAKLRRAPNRASALTYLATDTPSAILVGDPDIVENTNEMRDMSIKLRHYVLSGGTVILATTFSSYVTPPELDQWFREVWNLPWRFGDYHRTVVYLNSERTCLQDSNLPLKYSQKAVFLKNVPNDATAFAPAAVVTEESTLCSPSLGLVVHEQTPVVFAKIGDGWLGYVGDVNTEPESCEVIRAMCGL